MKVGLFIPCYVDQFYPHVGMATVGLLEKLGVDTEFPASQTCCGQPMSNAGCAHESRPLARRFLDIFHSFDYVVAPSGSCVAMIRHHYEALVGDDPRLEDVKSKTFELCEFLTDVLHVERIEGRFPYQVGVHQSCHGLRELRLAASSELRVPPFSKVLSLLSGLEDIRFSELQRRDECCGFGGMFAVTEEAVSCMMGDDRIRDQENAGTEILTAVDMSCLMHLDGIIRRQNKSIRVMHVAEILAGHLPPEVK